MIFDDDHICHRCEQFGICFTLCLGISTLASFQIGYWGLLIGYVVVMTWELTIAHWLKTEDAKRSGVEYRYLQQRNSLMIQLLAATSATILLAIALGLHK